MDNSKLSPAYAPPRSPLVTMAIVVGFSLLVAVTVYWLVSQYESPVTPTITEEPEFDISGLLYLSAVPTTGVNRHKNIFNLDLATGSYEQLTGVNDGIVTATDWQTANVSGDRYVLLSASTSDSSSSLTKPLPYRLPANTDIANNLIPLTETIGRRADQLRLSPSAQYVAVRSFTEVQIEETAVVPPNTQLVVSERVFPLREIESWQIEIIDVANNTQKTILDATHPRWLTDDLLLYVQADGLHLYDVQSDSSSVVLPIADFDADDALSVSVQGNVVQVAIAQDFSDLYLYTLMYDATNKRLSFTNSVSYGDFVATDEVLVDVLLVDDYLYMVTMGDTHQLQILEMTNEAFTLQQTIPLPFSTNFSVSLLHIINSN